MFGSVSGGKDGSYVAHQLKHKYKMRPLCVTVIPHLPTKIGNENLENFIKCGFNHISLNPDHKLLKGLIGWGLNSTSILWMANSSPYRRSKYSFKI